MGSAGYHRLVFINSKKNLSSVSFAVQYENHNDSLFKQWHPQLKDKLTKIIFLVNLGLSFLNLTDKRRGKRLIFLCYPTKCMSSIVIFPRTLIILDMIKECHNKGITVRCSGKFDFYLCHMSRDYTNNDGVKTASLPNPKTLWLCGGRLL